MIISASGGLVYHARAAFTQVKGLFSVDGEDRWASTRRCVSSHVDRWLSDLTPDTLIVFGPSAGYLLQPDFFANLDFCKNGPPLKIIAVDPDPVAAFLFRRRFSSSPIEWHSRHDLLPFGSPVVSTFGDFLDEASRKAEKPAILFLGLLGQLALHADHATRSTIEARRILQGELEDFNWASLHDLESATLTRGLQRLPPALRPESFTEAANAKRLGIQQLRVEFSADRLQNLGFPAQAWIDHDTDWLGPPEVVIPWLLTPRQFHHLGFVRTSIVVTD